MNFKEHFGQLVGELFSKPELYEQLQKLIDERIIPLSETGVSSRVFNHWKKERLLMDDPMQGKWIKLNFYEYVWVRIIKSLRDYGCSIELIRKVKKIMSKVSVMDEKDYDTEAMKTTIKRIKSLDISEDYKKEIIESINEKGLHLFIHESGFDFRLFYILTFACILGIERCGFLIMDNHEILPWLGYLVLADKNIMELFSATHIYISFNDFILEFLKDKSKENYLNRFSFFTEEEIEILKVLRSKDFKSIELRPIKTKDGKKYSIIRVTDGNLPLQTETEITDALRLKNYESITLKKNDNSKIYFERHYRINI